MSRKIIARIRVKTDFEIRKIMKNTAARIRKIVE
jgi:hypothetical protein